MANVLLTGAAGAIAMDLAFSLDMAKINVFATEADEDNFSLVSKNCKYYNKVFRAPRAGNEDYINRINEIIVNENIDLVIPNPDFTGILVRREMIATVIAIPADGPSFGIAPAGT